MELDAQQEAQVEDACSTCGHPRAESHSVRAWSAVRRRLGLRPSPARCLVMVTDDDPSGWGSACDCDAPFHGA